MSDPCTNLALLGTMTTSLPALFVAMTVVLGLMVMDKLEGRYAWILILVCVVAAFLPALVMWMFGSKLLNSKAAGACVMSAIMSEIGGSGSGTASGVPVQPGGVSSQEQASMRMMPPPPQYSSQPQPQAPPQQMSMSMPMPQQHSQQQQQMYQTEPEEAWMAGFD